MPLPLLVALAASPGPALPPPPRPLVVGHRGARARFPENTLPAVRHALEAGADAVEVDVRLSADDVPVVAHDATLPDRCRGLDGRPAPAGLAVRALSFAALRRYDCGAVPDRRFPEQRAVPGTPIPSLDELLALLSAEEPPAARGALLFLELKSEEAGRDVTPARAAYARIVVRALRGRDFGARTVVLSFDHALLAAVRAEGPELATLPLLDREADLLAVARREGSPWVGPRHDRVDAAAVVALHAAGVRVFAWTANARSDQERLARIGVDAIGTDDPAALAARLARSAE